MAGKASLQEGAAVGTPSAGWVYLFPSGGQLYSKDSTGAVTLLGNLAAGSGLVSEGFNLHAQVGSGLYLQDDLFGVDFTQVAPSGDYVTQAEADVLYAASGFAYAAGSGLVVGNGEQYHVQVGSGMYLQDDLVGVDLAALSVLYDASGAALTERAAHESVYDHDAFVSNTRTLTAGSGLIGGGDLSADRRFDIVGHSGITVLDDGIEVDQSYLNTIYSLSGFGGGGGGTHTLLGGQHSDTTGTAASGHILGYDGTNWRPRNEPSSADTLTVHSTGEVETRTVIQFSDFPTANSGILFPNIPGDYDDLLIIAQVRTDGSSTYDQIISIINGDTNVQHYRFSHWYNTGGTVVDGDGNSNRMATVLGASSPASNYADVEVWMRGYTISPAGGRHRNALGKSVGRSGPNNLLTGHHSQNWENSDPITSIYLRPNDPSGNFISGCHFTLIGVRRQTVITSGSYGALKIVDGVLVP